LEHQKLALFGAYRVKIRFLMYRFSRKSRIETDQPAIDITDQSAATIFSALNDIQRAGSFSALNNLPVADWSVMSIAGWLVSIRLLRENRYMRKMHYIDEFRNFMAPDA